MAVSESAVLAIDRRTRVDLFVNKNLSLFNAVLERFDFLGCGQ
jgi:hypothetical protein